MRICIVTVAGFIHGAGGMQDHTTDLVLGLSRAGHEVEVITARHPEGLRECEHAGARWHFVDAPVWRARMPIRHPEWHRRSALRFLELHAQRPFDVVHSESTSALGLLHRRLHRTVPIVGKFHGNYLGFVRAGLRRAISEGGLVREAKSFAWVTSKHFLTRGNWYLFRACENMVPSRAQLADTCRSHMLKRARTHVVPNGIDATMFSPGSREEARAALGLDSRPLFVCVGSLYREKGTRHAIRALTMLDDETPGLLIVGGGEERPALEALAHELGVAERVLFVGMQPRDRVPTYLQAADAFLFPTELPEAAPLSLPQAMACGLPAVASRIGAVPEVIDSEWGNGVLVAPGNVVELAQAMRRLLRDQSLRRTVGEAGRKRVVAAFTVERMIERSVWVYGLAARALGTHVT